jgi:hypothetical protein
MNSEPWLEPCLVGGVVVEMCSFIKCFLFVWFHLSTDTSPSTWVTLFLLACSCPPPPESLHHVEGRQDC